MPDVIPPEVQAKIAEGVAWLWGQYGQPLVEKTAKRSADEAKWRWSIEKYYTSLFERVGFVRVLGRMEAEPLENVFTHVNVLDKLSAERRYDIPRLLAEFSPRDFSWTERVKRLPGDAAVADYPKLFILGKPGAGKTTFLKHTALRAINREIKKVPVFVTLKELSDSGLEILPFIVRQFTIHRFPEPEAFVERLLKDGNALVLLDGLDEVNLEDNKRAEMIRALNAFVYQYSDCPMLLTCRVAATDYSFTQFEYVEMADFDEGQMGRYIELWFAQDLVKRENCRRALLEDGANRGIRELAQVPLLLALLCLVYEERGEFPPNRDEIYDEATRALLVKWDSSRNIARDTVYQQLSLKHKQKMLARIAAETFSAGEYFLPERRVVALIEDYLGGVPGLEDPDGALVLAAMEAQHGIFVERARGIHSFSHLTLQEYFAARYIVDNEQRGTVEQLMRYVGDDRWREVFKLTAGMLDNATEFFDQYLAKVPALLGDDPDLLALLQWGAQKSAQSPFVFRQPAQRAFLLYLARARTRDRNPAHALAHDFAFASDSTLALVLPLDRARILALALVIALDHAHVLANLLALGSSYFLNSELTRDLALALEVADNLNLTDFRAELTALVLPDDPGVLDALVLPDDPGVLDVLKRFVEAFIGVLEKYQNEWNPYLRVTVTKEDAALFVDLSEEQLEAWERYLKTNQLLVECLQLAYVPDRAAIEDQLLLPPPGAAPAS